MKFTPTYEFLVTLLAEVGIKESKKYVDDVISDAKLPKHSEYEIHDFIRICEELKKKGGIAEIVGISSIVQARYLRSKKAGGFRRKREGY